MLLSDSQNMIEICSFFYSRFKFGFSLNDLATKMTRRKDHNAFGAVN